MDIKLVSIGKAAEIIGVSVDTLRRWDKSGKLLSVKRPSGHRYYNLQDVEDHLAKSRLLKMDLFASGISWASLEEVAEPEDNFYCSNSSVFLSRLTKLQNEMSKEIGLENIFPLVVAIAGEIGDNSFAHNIGRWPDIPGIFFGYSLKKREIILCDRGQGIFATLKRVRPNMKDDLEAVRVAFTEIVSGRAPEERGNGLKFVRSVVSGNDISLYFRTGDAELKIKKGDDDLLIEKTNSRIRGCVAFIKF